jgi:RHS repeat-associated protein
MLALAETEPRASSTPLPFAAKATPVSVTWPCGPGNGIKAFTGREWDPETNLYYYRARYYDPKIGRFISEDPIGFGGGVNFYAYALGNPVSFIDPSGLDVWIEGPSGNEPTAHQSINVGDPNGLYMSMSWGITGLSPFGHVYSDPEVGGPIEKYAKTTPEQDAALYQDLLNDLRHDRGSAVYGTKTCRNYSQDKFKEYKDRHGLSESTPPGRAAAPRGPLRRVSGPTTGPTSSTTSSSGSSTSK